MISRKVVSVAKSVLFAWLFAGQAVLFSATLRLPSKFSKQKKARCADAVLNELLLTPFANDLIGDDILQGVSPEVRKKVTIAVEVGCVIFMSFQQTCKTCNESSMRDDDNRSTM